MSASDKMASRKARRNTGSNSIIKSVFCVQNVTKLLAPRGNTYLQCYENVKNHLTNLRKSRTPITAYRTFQKQLSTLIERSDK